MKRNQTQKQHHYKTLVVDEPMHELVLFNDDVNTFPHVIDTLVEVCEHEPEQAEQCAFIVHYKGKCVVKKGSFDELKEKCLQLLDRKLNAQIL